MIQEFVDRFMANKDILRANLQKLEYPRYLDLIKATIEVITSDGDFDETPDPSRIYEINDGDYQGTLVYIIGATGYQPYDYWYIKVSYGSCSGCDTLESIMWGTDDPREEMLDDMILLCLHLVQGLKLMGKSDDSS